MSDMANRRSGRTKGYRSQKGGAHQIPWDQDPVILTRVELGIRPWMQRKTAAQCADIVNAQMAVRYPEEPPVGDDTILADRNRAMELRKRQAVNSAEEHLAEWDHVLAEAHRLLSEQKTGSQNITGLVNAIAGIVEKKAKLDGSMVERKNVQLAAEMTLNAPEPLPEVTASDFGEACGVLYQQSEEFRRGFDKAVGAKVIEIKPLAITEQSQDNPIGEHSGSNGHGVVDFAP